MSIETAPAGLAEEVLLTPEAVRERRHRDRPVRTVTFGVGALYGLSRHSIRMPVSPREGIDSGQVCITMDPEAAPGTNLGIADFAQGRLTVTYGIQAVFPGLYRLITEGRHDPGLLHPVRAVATDECTMSAERDGWRALGCLEFLPGGLWSGTEGG